MAAVEQASGADVHAYPAASSNPTDVFNIGTRKSLLARNQTDIVIQGLKGIWADYGYNVHAVSTMGDKNQVTALHDFGAKSLWTFELEDMLVKGEVDFIVHSLKDIPTQMAPELTIGAIPPRGDPRDALVLSPRLDPQTTLSSLPPGSVIGTSSVRRSAQMKRIYPHLEFQSVRGNVGTRLSKLDDPNGPYAAIILAAAGLHRTDLGHRISRYLGANEPEEVAQGRQGMLHAVGQGALGVQTRTGDERVDKLLAPIKCPRTTMACLAERSLMRALEGGCSVPIGVETEWLPVGQETASPAVGAAAADVTADSVWAPSVLSQRSNNLSMKACVVSLDGKEAVTTEVTKHVDTEHAALEFGLEVAKDLVDKGAAAILEKINLNRDIIENQDGGA